jgi:hypothetical protein
MPPQMARPCEPTCLTARSTRHYIARKTENHYTGYHNCIIETVNDTPPLYKLYIAPPKTPIT